MGVGGSGVWAAGIQCGKAHGHNGQCVGAMGTNGTNVTRHGKGTIEIDCVRVTIQRLREHDITLLSAIEAPDVVV